MPSWKHMPEKDRVMSDILSSRKRSSEGDWISVSDLMAGLMMVFMFLAVIYAKDANQRAQNVTEIVTEWQDTELEIYQALKREFADDLPRWNAEIEPKSFTIRFLSPEVLFAQGSAALEPRFENILTDFIPRYIRLLNQNFKDAIREIRIEGHTSSGFYGVADDTEAFIRNMALSQARTRTVLNFSMNIPGLERWKPWMRRTISANGLSSARIIRKADGSENKQRSRRVEFTIRTKTKEALFEVLDRIAPAIEKQI